jgi:aerobic carbon-monoxide dehydrogenase medium subunit
VIPPPFDYARAESAAHALELLSHHGDEAKVLAGGHSLLPLMKMRLAAPTVLIDVGRVAELSYIRSTDDHVAIGALTRHRDIETSSLLHGSAPLLAHAAGHVGDPQVRHRGTIGGSIAHADPASDLPAVLLALDATLVITGPAGQRTVPARDFFLGFLESVLEPTELLTEIRVRPVPDAGWSFQKFTRRAQDWAIVGVAAVHSPAHTGVGLVNMGQTPLLAAPVVDALRAGATATDAPRTTADDTDPPDDGNGSADYRRHLARVLVQRALVEAGVPA